MSYSVSRTYHPQGALAREEHRVDGVRQPGPAGEPSMREWHPDGILKSEEHWVDGEEVTGDQARQHWDWDRRSAAAIAAPSSLTYNVLRCH